MAKMHDDRKYSPHIVAIMSLDVTIVPERIVREWKQILLLLLVMLLMMRKVQMKLILMLMLRRMSELQRRGDTRPNAIVKAGAKARGGGRSRAREVIEPTERD